VITAILVVGIKESARFNATIVTIKGCCGAVLIVWASITLILITGATTGPTSRPMVLLASELEPLTYFFAYIGFDAVSTTAQECKNPQRDLPIGIMASLSFAPSCISSVAGVLTGMVRWQDINIEAPIAVAFLDRGLYTASHIITIALSPDLPASCW